MTAAAPRARSPLAFYLVVIGLAVPIWSLSRYLGVIGALKVPVTDLMLGFAPLVAGALLVLINEGRRELARFLLLAFDFRKLTRTAWIIPVLFLPPLVDGVTYVILHLAGHRGEPHAALLALPILTPLVFLLAIGEEAGWTGYLTDPLQSRFGALGAALIIAVPWWLGHIPSILEIGGTVTDIAWWLPGAFALRVLILWLYNNTGRSLSAVVVFHTMLNVARWVSFPAIGSHYDTAYQAVSYSIVAIVAIAVVLIWGSKTLTRRRADARARAAE